MNGKSRHPCLVPNVREKIFSLSSWCMLTVVGFFVSFFHRCSLSSWSIFPVFLTCWEFLIINSVGICPIFFLPVRTSSPEWRCWTLTGPCCQTPGEACTLSRVIFKGRARWQSPCVATSTGGQGRGESLSTNASTATEPWLGWECNALPASPQNDRCVVITGVPHWKVVQPQRVVPGLSVPGNAHLGLQASVAHSHYPVLLIHSCGGQRSQHPQVSSAGCL